MAASNDRNKVSAGGTFGDTDPMYPSTEPDNKADRARDGAGIPQVGETNSNFFPVAATFGDTEPLTHWENDNAGDFAHDTAGIPNVNQGEQTNMELTLKPNMFPRQTGHDTADDITLT